MSSENVGIAFGLCVAAGLATTIGALVPFVQKAAGKIFLGSCLGFSAGVMMYVSFVEIFYKSKIAFIEALPQHATLLTSSCFFGGIILAALINYLVHKLDDTHSHELPDEIPIETPQQTNIQDATSSTTLIDLMPTPFRKNPWQWLKDDWSGKYGPSAGEGVDRAKLKKTGLITALAIAIHNFPEGLATFVAALSDPVVGVALAVAIAIHNIPEGVCVAMPIYHATGSRMKGFLYGFFSGVSEPLGALIGWAIIFSVSTDPIMYGVLFGLVAGMMVFISITELLPTAQRYDPQGHYSYTSCFIGMVVMAASLLLFEY